MTNTVDSKKGLLVGPSFCFEDSTCFHISDIESLTPFTDMDSRGECKNGWHVQIFGKTHSLSNQELELLIPGLAAEYEHVSRSTRNPDMSTVAMSWLQQHYLVSWFAVPALEAFSVWKLIRHQDFTSHLMVDSDMLAKLYPAMQLMIDLGAPLVEQKVAMDSYLRQPSTPTVEIPDDFSAD